MDRTREEGRIGARNRNRERETEREREREIEIEREREIISHNTPLPSSP